MDSTISREEEILARINDRLGSADSTRRIRLQRSAKIFDQTLQRLSPRAREALLAELFQELGDVVCSFALCGEQLIARKSIREADNGVTQQQAVDAFRLRAQILEDLHAS